MDDGDGRASAHVTITGIEGSVTLTGEQVGLVKIVRRALADITAVQYGRKV
jgi:hypothetical protein